MKTPTRARKFCCLLLVSLAASCSPSPPVPTDLEHSLIITGDGGSIKLPMIYQLVAQAEIVPKLTTLVFLGDNVYPDGDLSLQTKQSRASLERFSLLLESIKDTGAEAVFVPGNHDWGSEALKPSWKKLVTQSSVVSKILGAGHYAPRPGCPGPATFNIGSSAVGVVIDSEWILRKISGTVEETPHCSVRTLKEFAEHLKNTISRFAQRKILLFAHHPLKSYGPNGHLKDNYCPQRFSCEAYQHYLAIMSAVLKTNKPIACAGGHDHNLQVIEGDNSCDRYLVSGALSDLHVVQPSPSLQFALAGNGVMRIDFYREGPVRIQVILPGGNQFESAVAFQRLIAN